MKKLGLFDGIIMLICLNLLSIQAVFGQTRSSLFVELGAQRLLFQLNDAQGLHTQTPAYNFPSKIGLAKEHEKSSLSFGFQVFMVKEPDPSWNPPPASRPKLWSGGTPDPTFGVFFGYDRTIIGNHNSKFFIDAGVSPSIGIIPTYFFDGPSSPIDTSELSIYKSTYPNGNPPNNFSFNGFSVLGDSSRTLYENFEHQRAVSPFYFLIQTHLVFGIKLSESIRLSIMPTYSLGLVKVYKNDFVYHDFARSINGRGSLSTNGSSFGLRFRISILLPAEKQKSETSNTM